MSKMNASEQIYYQHLLKKYPRNDIKCQHKVALLPEVGINWQLDFVLEDYAVDVKGRLHRDTAMKAKMWEVLGDRPLHISRVFNTSGRIVPSAIVTPDKQKIKAFIVRLEALCEVLP